jgi:hypothetical protein
MLVSPAAAGLSWDSSGPPRDANHRLQRGALRRPCNNGNWLSSRYPEARVDFEHCRVARRRREALVKLATAFGCKLLQVTFYGPEFMVSEPRVFR